MASIAKETLLDGFDVIKLAESMTLLHISPEGLTTADEMKTKVIEEIDKSRKQAKWTAGQAFSVFLETKNEDERKREMLLQLYSSTEKCLKDMQNDTLIRLLDNNLTIDVKEAIKNYQKRLSVKECVVLVAGETSAGKSSLINLILGEELLPNGLLSTTSTICELKYGEKRKIVVHYKNKDQEPKEIFFSPPKQSQSYLVQISVHMDENDDQQRGSSIKKIELFWPHELLKNGIVIVDSPGIGESEMMDQIVTKYIPEAFCFIYVINSPNAGGVQKDRIVKLVEDARKVSIQTEQRFLCECALFVCNKWDAVKADETNKVKEHVIKRLEECWPNLEPKLQVLFLSTSNAGKLQHLGAISEDFETLITGIESMVLRSIEARLQIYWRWLDYLLSRMIYYTKAFIHNVAKDREEVNCKLALVVVRVKEIENDQNSTMKQLEGQLHSQIEEIVKKLSEYLTSKEVELKLISWTDAEAPTKQGTWKTTEESVMEAVKDRFLKEMEHWEKVNHVFSGARDVLMKHFSAQLSTVQAQIENVENFISTMKEESSHPNDWAKYLTTSEKILIGLTSPIWVPVGLVLLVAGLPVYGAITAAIAIQEKNKIRSYDRDKCDYLTSKSKEYLTYLTKENALRSYVARQLEEVRIFLDQINAKIPAIIRTNLNLLRQLIVENISREMVENVFRPVNAECMTIRGNLAFFAIKEVRPTDIDCKELDLKEDADNLLGRGKFATVYEGKIQIRGKKQPVAVKVFNDTLNSSNASSFLAEEEILRKLCHPNIVKFYGTTLFHRHSGGTTMMFVMELCQGSLKDHREKHPEKIPGKRENVADLSGTKYQGSIVKTVIKWAREISFALDYIHKNGIMHRDLKTENILISCDDSAKIADVGISTKVEDVTGTLAGTPIYMAPEVFASKVYDSKADMYSFGLILWEMWYGEIVFSELGVISFYDFRKKILHDYRPTPPNDCMPAPITWDVLMRKCWSTKPENRVTARECGDEFNIFLKQFNE